MRRRALVGTVATLGLVALVGLFAALSLLFSSPGPAYAQTNSAPEFSAEIAAREVAENSPAFHKIGLEVTATDTDTNDRLVYTLENARTSPFTIVRATGQLQVGQPLDYEDEDNSTHTVVVLVTDGKDDDDNVETHPVTDDTITVTITVTNVDDPGKVSLTWTKLQVGIEVTASLTDSDGDDTGTTWRWDRSQSSAKNSDYDPISGAASATYTPTSSDVSKYVRAVASYTDPEGANKTARSVAAYVRSGPTQSDPNRPPKFNVNTQGGYGCIRPDDPDFDNESAEVCLYVKRYASPGSDIYYPARATDLDLADQVHYSLSGTDNGKFKIDKFSGELFTTDAHAYNSPGSDGKFEITITATDPHQATASITAAIRPSASVNAPVVRGPSTIRYPENGTWPLATYSASIDGRGIGEGIGWIIGVEPGGGDGDFFDIDYDGNLTFTQPPDYENPADYPYIEGEDGDNRYSFILHVYDSNSRGGYPGATFFRVTVIVEDVTVEALEIDGPSAVDYPENGDGPVYSYTLKGGSGLIEWLPPTGADGGEFSLSTDGELTFNRQPDFENPTDVGGPGGKPDNAYLVTITVYRGSESKTEFVRVRVTDVNEPPEFDEGATATRSVEPDAEVNDRIGDPVKATDPDKNAGLTYRLEATPAPPFQIDQWTGQLSVSGATDQNQGIYTMTVFVTDGRDDEGNSDTTADDRITVTINVASGGNNAPVFPAEAVTLSINENTTTVQDVGTPVVATDDDTDDTLAYTLGGTEGGILHHWRYQRPDTNQDGADLRLRDQAQLLGDGDRGRQQRRHGRQGRDHLPDQR